MENSIILVIFSLRYIHSLTSLSLSLIGHPTPIFKRQLLSFSHQMTLQTFGHTFSQHLRLITPYSFIAFLKEFSCMLSHVNLIIICNKTEMYCPLLQVRTLRYIILM